MVARARRRRIIIGAGLGLAASAGIFAIALFTDCEVCEAANQIILQGTVRENCTIAVNASAAASRLPIDNNGNHRVMVGTVLQSCNKKVGYTLDVSSQNCSGQPNGAKLVNGPEHLSYHAEFLNPTTGGSDPIVTGLLERSCNRAQGRDVSGAKVRDEVSTIFVHFQGSQGLGAGTYQDTLTITMNVK